MIGQCNGLGECTDLVRGFPVGGSVVSFDCPSVTAICLRPAVVCAIALAIGEQLLVGGRDGTDSGLKQPDVVHVKAILSQRAIRPCIDRPESAAYPAPICLVIAVVGICGADGILALLVEEKNLRFTIVTKIFVRGVQMSLGQGSRVAFFGIGEIGVTVLKHEAKFVALTSSLVEAE